MNIDLFKVMNLLFSLSNYIYQFPLNFYIQGFVLYRDTENTYIDFTDLGGKKYKTDYCDKFYMATNFKSSYKISFGASKSNTLMLLTYCNAGGSNDKKLEEKENITVSANGRALIQLKMITDKKYIKDNSSVNNFYWDYIYSQTDDVNYIPKITFRTMHFQKRNVAYIDNPYKYKNIKTNYVWFIYLKHYNKEDSIFSYEYTNEGENKTKDDDKGSSNLWILVFIILPLILIIIIGFVAFYFIRKKRLQSNSKIETLVNEM